MSRRVPANDVPLLREDLINAQRFEALTEQLAQLNLANTRQLRDQQDLRDARLRDGQRMLQALLNDRTLVPDDESARAFETRYRQRSIEVYSLFGPITLKCSHYYHQRQSQWSLQLKHSDSRGIIKQAQEELSTQQERLTEAPCEEARREFASFQTHVERTRYGD